MPARAKLPPGEGKRVPLNMRTTRQLRERLEQSAADSGRSLAQEVEIRLEQSFDRADIALEVMGHRDNTAFVNLMRMMFQSICKRTGAESVWNEERAFVEARAAILEFFDQYGLTAGFKARSKHMMRETARDGARMLASLLVDDAVKRK